MTSQQFLVCDSSTLANFKQWAQAISNFFSTAGWVQTSDTGQVNWSTIASVPGAAAYVYEVWKPGDALTAFYVKVEYGNFSGTNSPCVRIQIGTATNGAGTLTGFRTELYTTQAQGITPPSTTTQYECDFSGDSGRMCVMLWRNGTNSVQQFFGIERSLDSTGAPTPTHVTLAVVGCGGGTNTGCAGQQSLIFAVGAALPSPAQSSRSSGNAIGGLITRCPQLGTNVGATFNGSIPMDTISPEVGFFDYSLTMCGTAMLADIAEGVTFTVTLYGSVRTYMPSKLGPFSGVAPGNQRFDITPGMAFIMRYD